MRTSRTFIGLVVVTGCAVVGSLLARAQQPPSSEQPQVGLMMLRWQAPQGAAREQDRLYVSGRAVAVGATPGAGNQAAKPLACFSCHGLDGAGDASGAFPRLSGQPAYYLYKQLVDYASGSRPSAVMSPIAQALGRDEMEAVAAYYAAQRDAAATQTAAPDVYAIQRGGAMSAVGAPEKGIQACVNCHGPTVSGLPPTVPYLAGQYPTYVSHQLQEWQEGKRQNDPLGVMADIARRMTAEDVAAVAAYFSQLPPPGARPRAPAAVPAR